MNAKQLQLHSNPHAFNTNTWQNTNVKYKENENPLFYR